MMHTDYSRPTQLDEACASLASQGNECALLAGGTDLIVRMRSRARQPKLLIDLKAIPEMQGIVPLEGGGWRINACVSMHELANHAALQAAYPAITMGAAAVGSLQIRQRATVGGNLANASPCMDTAPGIIVYDGQLRLRSVRGERLVPAASFFRSAGKNALEPDELLLAIELPPPGRKRSSFDKIKRTKGHDLALVNMAACFDPELERLTFTIGSCAAVPIALHLDTAQQSPESVAEAAAVLAVQRIAPIDDVRASAEYRRDMAALLARRLTLRLLTQQSSGETR